ncbi:protogenin A-like isoform X2 [Halichondria panicea]
MQPISQFNVVPGSNVQFSVTLGPLPTISMFVWRINGSQINGSQTDGPLNNKYTGLNTSRLTVLSVDESDEGLYTVEVLATIGDGNVSFSNISEPAWLTVLDPPTIVTQPSNLTVRDVLALEGQRFQLSVEATGMFLTFQWQRFDLDIFDTPGLYNGTTTNTLTVLNLLTAADGDNEIEFSVNVSNPAALIFSETATVTVLYPPVITQQPVDVVVPTGGNATFTVVATSSGGGRLSYQWFRLIRLYSQEVPLNDSIGANVPGPVISGARLSTLILVGVSAEQFFRLRVRVSNEDGNTTSNIATLEILSPPTILTQPLNATSVRVGTSSVFLVTAQGESLSYQWLRNGLDISDTPGRYAGTTSRMLTILRAIEDDNMAVFSVNVSNQAGSVISREALITVLLPPVVTIMPTDATVLPGGTVTFTATATSQINSTEFTFQWFEFPRNLSAFRLNDSETVSGSNTFTLTVRGVNERRIFAVQVTDGEGGMSVDSVTVTVQLVSLNETHSAWISSCLACVNLPCIEALDTNDTPIAHGDES